MSAIRHPFTSAFAAVLAITLGSCTDSPPSCDLALVDQLDIEGAMAHMAYLSESIGPRVVSTPEEKEAAEYIAGELEGYGYEVEIQEFPRETVHAHLTVETAEPQALNIRVGGLRGVSAPDYPLLTPEGGINAKVIYSGNGEEGAFSADVSGQIALVTRSDEDPAEVISRAGGAGAVAVLFHNTEWRNYGVRVAEADIPFGTMNSEAADVLKGLVEPTVI